MRKGKSPALIVCVLILLISVPAFSQMRIARPVDGATVRETVSILVPVSSVPSNPGAGFIAVSVDGVYKAASGERSDDGRYVVYRWDTKAIEVSPETGEQKGRPKDGKHTIRVQAYTSDGKKTGPFGQITIYVKNNASADMPAGGLKLRYKSPVGSVELYRFKYTVDLKSIEGATNLAAAVGDAMEGAEGMVRRSVEDTIDKDSVLVRQKLIGTLQMYFAGQANPAPVNTKSEYHVEDNLGHTTYVMYSSSPGAAIGIDLPILPSQSVKIGDAWSEPMKLFKAALTGESARLNAVSTLEGLEWEGGHPCARIKTTFSGDVRIPSSTLLKKPLFLNGEAITYFAYRTGKVISFRVRAFAQPEQNQTEVQALTQALLSAKSAPGSQPGEGLAGRFSSIGGPPSAAGTGQRVKIKLEFKQSLDLVE